MHPHAEGWAAPSERSEAGGPPMDVRAAELIEELRLRPHPEGGYFAEVFRSRRAVDPLDGRPRRDALTTIYFLLVRGSHSRWHRVSSDESWHHHEGDPLELFWVDSDALLHEDRLGVADAHTRPISVVPAGCWQAARSSGAYTLVSCSVGPGFDFADFEMITIPSAEWTQLQRVPGLPAGFA